MRLPIHRGMLRNLILLVLVLGSGAPALAATPAEPGSPLVIGNRSIHVFRAPLGAFTAAERADGARQRIERAFAEGGEGWTSTAATDLGVTVALDGKPMFTIVPGDARELAGETPDALANAASRALHRAWTESRESRDAGAALRGAGKSLVAALLLALAIAAIVRLSSMSSAAIRSRLTRRLGAATGAGITPRMASLVPAVASRLTILAAWILGLLAAFLFLAYTLSQFVLTRPAGEGLTNSLAGLATEMLNAVANAVPGMFVAAAVFLVAWLATQMSTELFGRIAARHFTFGALNHHTAPATRRITNVSIWLFAVAMAYPYLPGSHTEAFKGLSVIIGVMVSIGASGLVGQIASGVMLVYTNAVAVGEYVRVQDSEGVVTDLGLFVTRIRTGLGEEIALPNALVLGHVIRNYSRAAPGSGVVLDSAVTIGYDTPWRQVHAMLLEAAKTIPEIQHEPAPYVVQTALSDFYVEYRLVSVIPATAAPTRARIAGALHAAIQDAFNRHGVQIMSPHYRGDPAAPKLVPESNWYAPPAERRT